MLHGIVGQLLSVQRRNDRAEEFYEQLSTEIESLPQGEREEFVQDYVPIPALVESDHLWNPLSNVLPSCTKNLSYSTCRHGAGNGTFATPEPPPDAVPLSRRPPYGRF
jgi:hypothetical protein